MAAGHDELGEALERPERAEWRFDRSATACGSAAGLPSQSPATLPGQSPAALPDYGDILCWGIIGILLPVAGLAVYIALIVLHVLEFSAARKAITEGRLQPSDYSKIHPVLFILGLVAAAAFAIRFSCISEIGRDILSPSPTRSGSPIVAVIVSIGINVAINIGTVILQQSTQ